MKKFLLIIFIILIGITSLYIYSKLNNQNANPIPQVEKELYSYNYFDPMHKEYYYGNEFAFKNSIYYKEINNYNEYLIYKNYYPDIIEMSENDFNNSFIVLTIVENESTKNLKLLTIDIDNETLYIGLDKTNPDNEPNFNRGISIKIDNSLKRNNIEVFKTIKNTNFMKTYSNIKNLPFDYSIDDAKNDNCFIVSSNPAYNITVYNDFINNIENKQDSEIRVVYSDSDFKKMHIYDIKYVSLENKYYICKDTTRVSTTYNSNTYYLDSYNYYEFDSFEKIDTTSNFLKSNITNCIFKNSKFPENMISFSFIN